MPFDDLLTGPNSTKIGAIQLLRDHLSLLYPSTEKALNMTFFSPRPPMPYSPYECTLTILDRRNCDRILMIQAEVMNATKIFFRNHQCGIFS